MPEILGPLLICLIVWAIVTQVERPGQQKKEAEPVPATQFTPPYFYVGLAEQQSRSSSEWVRSVERAERRFNGFSQPFGIRREVAA